MDAASSATAPLKNTRVPHSPAVAAESGVADIAEAADRDEDPREAAKPLDGKVVVIDPGHNGGNFKKPQVINRKVNVLTQWKACDTTGTSTDDGYSEAAFTWDVSRRLAKLLRDRGATVKLTRNGNDGVGRASRGAPRSATRPAPTPRSRCTPTAPARLTA